MKTYFPNFYKSFCRGKLEQKIVLELKDAIHKQFYPPEGDHNNYYDCRGEFPLMYVIRSVVSEMEDIKKSKLYIDLDTSMESFNARLKFKTLTPIFSATIPMFWLEHGGALYCTSGFDSFPEEVQKKLTEDRIKTLTYLAEAIVYAIVYSLFKCLLDNERFFEVDEETGTIYLERKRLLTFVILETPNRMLMDYPMHLLRKDNDKIFNNYDLIPVMFGARPFSSDVGKYFDSTSLNKEGNYDKYLDINSILDSELTKADVTFCIGKEVLYEQVYEYTLFRLGSVYKQDTIESNFYIKHIDWCNETRIFGSHVMSSHYRRNNYLTIDYAFVVDQLGDCFKKKKPATLKNKYYRDWKKESINPLLDSGDTPGELLYSIKYRGVPRDTQEED